MGWLVPTSVLVILCSPLECTHPLDMESCRTTSRLVYRQLVRVTNRQRPPRSREVGLDKLNCSAASLPIMNIMATPSMRIRTLALVVMQARGDLPYSYSCPSGCPPGLPSATFNFDAGSTKVSGSCPGTAQQDCVSTAPDVFQCCDGFTFTINRPPWGDEVWITHPNTVLVNLYRRILRTDNPLTWQDTQFVSCTGSAPPLLATVDYTPPTTPEVFRLSFLEICYEKCSTPGIVCGDPKLVGGDGVGFYFHGRKDRDFCLVSDSDLHINAHFIGKRPARRTRDFTWVQALGFVYGSHTLTGAAKRSVAHWDSAVDHLEFVYNGEALTLSLTSPGAVMTLMRTGAANAVDLEIREKMGVSLYAVPIGKHESDVHHYGITGDDCFAHFDMPFRFYNLSTSVNGVLGQTYQPGFVSPAKRGVAMPVIGGADRFGSSSLLATDCAVSQYTATALAHGSAMRSVTGACGSSDLPYGVPGGITCRK